MTVTLSKRLGIDLSSRAAAAQLRDHLFQAIEQTGGVVIDFDGVRTLSESFADELFAVAVQLKGEDWFRGHVRIINILPLVRQSILDAVLARQQVS